MVKESKLFLGGNKKEGESKICPDAISYIESNKKIILPAKDVPIGVFGNPEELPFSGWFVKEGDNKPAFRFFDEDGSLAEVEMNYDNIYDITNDSMFEGLTEVDDIRAQKHNKFVEEIQKNKFDLNVGSTFKANAKEAIEEYQKNHK